VHILCERRELIQDGNRTENHEQMATSSCNRKVIAEIPGLAAHISRQEFPHK
jgi:hypothetical protein